MRKCAAATSALLLSLALSPASAVVPTKEAVTPADAFLAALAGHCGKAYAGRIVANEPAAAPGAPPDPFEGKTLVMHVRECAPGEIRVPFHVGEDRSRTWVITRTDDGLRLKHDHRHEDGSPDVLTLYGGDTTTPGTATRQEFPADAESKALFERQGLQGVGREHLGDRDRSGATLRVRARASGSAVPRRVRPHEAGRGATSAVGQRGHALNDSGASVRA